jgi:hypothetical protein
VWVWPVIVIGIVIIITVIVWIIRKRKQANLNAPPPQVAPQTEANLPDHDINYPQGYPELGTVQPLPGQYYT